MNLLTNLIILNLVSKYNDYPWGTIISNSENENCFSDKLQDLLSQGIRVFTLYLDPDYLLMDVQPHAPAAFLEEVLLFEHEEFTFFLFIN